MLLWFSWYGFNCGSTLKVVGESTQIIGLIGINTSLSAVSGALISAIIHYFYHRSTNEIYSTTIICNGLLSGLVSITSGCNAYESYASLIIGSFSGIIYYGS